MKKLLTIKSIKPSFDLLPKIPMRMRITSVLLAGFLFQANAEASYSQSARISIEMNNATVEEVLNEIEAKSEFYFLYNNKLINVDRRVSVDVDAENIESVLQNLFKGTDVIYRIADKQIVLSRKDLAQNTAIDGIQQSKVITGTVVDPTGMPVIGANIMVKGTTNGTISDMDGNFSLEADKDAILVVSYIGFANQEIKVGNQSKLSIALKEDAEALDELVVVGYGTQKKASLTGSIANIGSEEIMKTRNENVENMISGKIAGVRVVQSSGEPGSYSSDMQIRGMGEPLVIIDGVPRDNMSRLEPNEIETFTVLKDASAAIYGVRAANGVVLITTKKGKGTKLTLDYTGSVGWQKAVGLPQTLNAADWMDLTNENSINRGGSLIYSADEINAYRTGEKVGTIWSNVGFDKTAPQTQHSFSAQGSSERMDFFLNFGYLKQDGFWSSGDLNYDRYNVRANVNGEILKGLKVGVQLSGMMDTKNQPYMDSWEVYKAAWMQIPTLPMYANNNPDYLQNLPGAYNPLAVTNADISGYRINQTKLFTSTFNISYDIPFVKGLQISALYSYDYQNWENKQFRKEYTLYDYVESTDSYAPSVAFSPSRVYRSYLKEENTLLQIKLNYTRSFSDVHNLGILALYEESTESRDNFNAQRDLPMDAVDEIFAGSTTNQQAGMGTGDLYKYTNKAFVCRVNYDYMQKYLAEFSIRYDGSSKFGPRHQWGAFPAGSVGWRISEESFMKDVEALSFVNNLKIRASYGVLGDDRASTYQYIAGYNYPNSGYVFGSEWVNGLGFRGMANPYITWYKAKTSDLGIDIDLWDGLLSFQGDIFQRKRTNLLATRALAVPGTLGASLSEENLNGDLTKGFEISISHRNQIGDFKYSVSGNLSYARTKQQYIERASSSNSYRNWRDNYNDRYNDFWWGQEFIGYYENMNQIWEAPIHDSSKGNSILRPGDYAYKDWNEDGVIDSNDEHPVAKNGFPRLLYGLNLSGEYKGFDINILFQGGAEGAVIYPEQLQKPLLWDRGGLDMFVDRWHTINPGDDPLDPNTQWIPGYYPSTNTGESTNYWTSTKSIENASYLRLKSVEIGYTLPKAILTKIGLQNVRFFVNGYNLLTFTGLKYCDPEHPDDSYGYLYPVTQSYNVGVNVTF